MQEHAVNLNNDHNMEPLLLFMPPDKVIRVTLTIYYSLFEF